MDSRQQPRQQPNVVTGPTIRVPPLYMMSPNPNTQLPFTSMPHHHHHYHHHQQQQPPAPVIENISASQLLNTNNTATPYGDRSSTALKRNELTDIVSGMRKRGRPRRYSHAGAIVAADLTPAKTQHLSSPPGLSAAPSTEPPAMKHGGRPSGSGKKKQDALGDDGNGFTPHVIIVENGEDIAAKIMALSNEGLLTVCVLSARGAISNVTLRHTEMSKDTVTYAGLFEIISLSGPLSEKSSGDMKMDGFTVSLAGPDGRVLGGVVVGKLTAASPVQVMVGTFIAEHKKSNSKNLKSSPAEPSPQTSTSPTFQGPSSDSSHDNDDDLFNMAPGFYNNATQSNHYMPFYHNQFWSGQTRQ